MMCFVLFLCVFVLFGFVSVVDYIVQSVGSMFVFYGNFQGFGFDGYFEKFEVVIVYDIVYFDVLKFDVMVDFVSVRIGDNDCDIVLFGSDFFDVV